jgi:hypothetical protein
LKISTSKIPTSKIPTDTRITKITLTLLLGLTLGACNPTTTGTTSGITDATADPLPADQGTDFANGYTSSTEQAVSSISLDDVITASNVTNPDTSGSSTASSSTAGSSTGAKSITINALSRKCRTIEQGSNDDGDDDGVPQEVTYFFSPTNPNCTVEISGGTRTLAGRLKIKNQEKGGYREELEVTITDKLTNQTIIEQRKGFAILFQGKQRLIKIFDLRVSRRINKKPEFSYKNTLTYTYVPDVLEDRKVNKALPAGTISVTGKSEWYEGERKTRSFLVSSPTALTYDPACVTQKGQAITGGTETLNQNGTLVQITYGSCGVAPSVQFNQ